MCSLCAGMSAKKKRFRAPCRWTWNKKSFGCAKLPMRRPLVTAATMALKRLPVSNVSGRVADGSFCSSWSCSLRRLRRRRPSQPATSSAGARLRSAAWPLVSPTRLRSRIPAGNSRVCRTFRTRAPRALCMRVCVRVYVRACSRVCAHVRLRVCVRVCVAVRARACLWGCVVLFLRTLAPCAIMLFFARTCR